MFVGLRFRLALAQELYEVFTVYSQFLRAAPSLFEPALTFLVWEQYLFTLFDLGVLKSLSPHTQNTGMECHRKDKLPHNTQKRVT